MAITLFSSLPVLGAPQIAWKASYSVGTNSDSKAFGIRLDSSQNIIVAGTSKTPQGNYDYLAIKYSPFGTNLWTRRYDSGTNEQLRGMAMDNEGSVLLTGTSGTVKYDSNGNLRWTAPYAGRAVATDSSNNVCVTGFSEIDFATVKLTPKGSSVWVRTHNNPVNSIDFSQAVTFDTSGNVYVGGLETSFYDPRLGYGGQLFVIKYSADGDQEWIQPASPSMASDGSEIKSLMVDVNGNAISTGNTTGFGASSFTTYKFWAFNGTQWHFFQRSFVEGVTSMVLDAMGQVYLTGSFPPPFDPQAFYRTYKLSTNGIIVWQADYFGPAPGYHRANAIALDAGTNVYITGQSTGIGTTSDWATIKYNPNGQEQWVIRYDGPVHGEDQATSIAVDNTGALYVAGFTTTTNGIAMLLIKYAELTNIQWQPDQSVLLQYFGNPGQAYRIQASTNLVNWDDIGQSTAGTNGIYRFTDTNATTYLSRFYRTVTP